MPEPEPPEAPTAASRRPAWLAPVVLAAAGMSVASGFAQFSATATLGDVAAAFGADLSDGSSVAAQTGLAGTTLGLGLALIRLASLGSLPLAELADRHGRRGVLLGVTTAGLAISALAALAPSFWFLVAILALSRPLLSATNAVSGVVAAEETDSRDRAKAVGLIAAAYGLGAGLTALVRGAGDFHFRTVFALAVVPLVLMPLLARPLRETGRYAGLRRMLAQEPRARLRLRLGRVPPALRGRLLLLAGLSVGIAFVTGPVNGLLFVYAERIVHLSPSTTGVVVLIAGPIGLAGLLAGRWAADRVGRRPSAAVAHAALAAAGIVTYRGGGPAAIGGYLLTVFAGGALSPAVGSLAAELFPTSSRATAAGWLTVSGVLGAVSGLVCFGALADRTGFAAAAMAICLPVALASPLWFRLPETRGMELEQSAPEPQPEPDPAS